MKNIDWIDESIRNLFNDIRAEVILADLIEAGIDYDDIIISPVGTSKRSHANDIFKAEWKELKSNLFLYNLYISREGIYDAMPEGIFHQPHLSGSNSSSFAMIDSVKRGKKEEEEARNFFLPFEQEFYYQRIAVEIQERKLISELQGSNSNMFVNFWKLEDCLDARQKSILLNILPISHKIVGDFKLTSQSFEMVLGSNVSIRMIDPIDKSAPKNSIAKMGEAVLGGNLVLGNTFNDGNPSIEIAIGPLKENRLIDFIPGGRGNEVFDFLCNFFIPIELDIKKKIIADESTFDSQITDKKEAMRLGYNVCLKGTKKSKLKAIFA